MAVKKNYVFTLNDGSIREKGGNKAKNLRFLSRNHYAVPKGWVVSWDALMDYQGEDHGVFDKLRLEFQDKIQPGKAYAIRSSSSVEDDKQHSFAGLFCSLLQVEGMENILEAILEVWKSLESEKLRTYYENQEMNVPLVQIGVIVQEMVPAIYSGVVFSKNPLTGLSETIIEVGRGTGDDQVEAKENPERWVSKWGHWLEKPKTSFITEDLALKLVEKTGKIAKKFGKPVDLEWAFDGKELYFLQVRPITQLDIPIYSNKITKEMLPGIIKPLVWSVNTRLINKIWADILNQLTGDNSIKPDMLTGYYYYRAYFNMALFGQVFESLGMPYEALELLLGLEMEGNQKPHMKPGLGILPRVPSLLSFTSSFLSAEKRFQRIYEKKVETYSHLAKIMDQDITPMQLLEVAEQIFLETEEVAYFNIMIPMQMMMYHRVLKSQLEKKGYDIRNLKLEGLEEAAEKHSPHFHLKKLQEKFNLPDNKLDENQEIHLAQDIEMFLKSFGHFSDSGNDCSSIPWRENPEIIRKMLQMKAHDTPLKDENEETKEFKISRRNPTLHFMLKRTSRFAIHREAISSLYTYGYGQFRTCFIQLGEDLAQRGIIEEKEDIFFLYWQELVNLIKDEKPSSQKECIEQRKKEMEEQRDIRVPELIFGDKQPPLQEGALCSLKGIPTSLGTYTGPARVLQGLSDFELLGLGDVLIIPFSDVGWSPLFARAGAVVAESGGILSHSSIVAREYKIPAVVSVTGACMIPDGTMVTVNGYTGEIIMVDT